MFYEAARDASSPAITARPRDLQLSREVRRTRGRFARAQRTHPDVLDSRFDLPCYAPQTAAFLVDASMLSEVRGALADVLRGDGRARDAFVEARHPAFARATRARRWRVPRATVDRLVAEVETHCSAEPELRADIAAARERFAARAPAGATLVVPAARWHWLERTFGPVRFMPDGWAGYFREALDDLFDDVEPPDAPRAVGDLAWVAEARVYRGGTDEPIAPAHADLFNDDVRFTLDGAQVDLPPYSFVDRVREIVGVRKLLEMLAGPFTPSRGPGPFLPRPAAAAPLIAPTNAPPLFCEVPLVAAHVLVGATTLDAARAEVEAARAPIKPWTGGELYEHSPTDPPWNVPWSALVPSWDTWRTRFVELLAEAAHSDEAVLLVDVEVGEMGPGGPMPVTEAWGEPVSD